MFFHKLFFVHINFFFAVVDYAFAPVSVGLNYICIHVVCQSLEKVLQSAIAACYHASVICKVQVACGLPTKGKCGGY